MPIRLLRLTLALALALVPAGRALGAAPRWLAAHVDSTMGLGDQLHLHHALLLLAGATDRTAVLPPLTITVTDYGALADIDPSNERAFDDALDRALDGRIRTAADLRGRLRAARPPEISPAVAGGGRAPTEHTWLLWIVSLGLIALVILLVVLGVIVLGG